MKQHAMRQNRLNVFVVFRTKLRENEPYVNLSVQEFNKNNNHSFSLISATQTVTGVKRAEVRRDEAVNAISCSVDRTK